MGKSFAAGAREWLHLSSKRPLGTQASIYAVHRLVVQQRAVPHMLRAHRVVFDVALGGLRCQGLHQHAASGHPAPFLPILGHTQLAQHRIPARSSASTCQCSSGMHASYGGVGRSAVRHAGAAKLTFAWHAPALRCGAILARLVAYVARKPRQHDYHHVLSTFEAALWHSATNGPPKKADGLTILLSGRSDGRRNHEKRDCEPSLGQQHGARVYQKNGATPDISCHAR